MTVIRNVHSSPAAVPAPNSNGAESLMFRFKVGKFSLFWNDSTGPLREAAPDVLALLENSPPADVEFGATLGLGIAQQGMRDAADYAEALRVKAFYPLHQDLVRSPALSAGFVDQAASEFERETSAPPSGRFRIQTTTCGQSSSTPTPKVDQMRLWTCTRSCR